MAKQFTQNTGETDKINYFEIKSSNMNDTMRRSNICLIEDPEGEKKMKKG